eukprot:scaffold237031_cov34-Prasinocladus_malaysianus.AAC.1
MVLLCRGLGARSFVKTKRTRRIGRYAAWSINRCRYRWPPVLLSMCQICRNTVRTRRFNQKGGRD